MAPRRLNSVYVRFLTYLTPMMLASFLTLVATFEYLRYQEALEKMEAELDTEIATASLLIAEGVANRDLREIRLALAATLANPSIAGIVVYDAQGDAMDEYGISPSDELCMKRGAGINFSNGDAIARVGTLTACVDAGVLRDERLQHIWHLSVMTFTLLILAVGSAFFAYRHAIGIPLMTLYDRIATRLRDGTHESVDWQSDDEIGQVIAEYNRMQQHITRQEKELLMHQNSLEEQLHQAQKMEAVGRLAGGIAHDFNNLLTGIMGYAHLARGKLTDGYYREAQQDLSQVMETSERAAAMVDRLLTFSRKQFVHPVALDINEEIESARDLLERLVRENVVIRTELTEVTPITLDRSQLDQILLNLALNARDAMPNGGTLTIGTGMVTTTEPRGERGAGEYVVLTYADTGHGIAAADMPVIFEPFFTTKDNPQSVGLGLSTVYGILKQCGGDVEVNSAIGSGSTFTLYFPAQRDATRAPESTASEVTTIRQGSGVILVVEDDQQVRTLIADVLTSNGFEVCSAETGEQAILELHQRNNDAFVMLITDIILPGVDGHGVARSFLERNPTSHILYISGHSEGPVVGDAFLRKPFSPDELERRVHGLLAQART